jgi:hypothetical protein
LIVNILVGSLMFFLPFSMLQILLNLQIFMFSFFLDLVLKLSKLNTSVSQIG